MAAPLRVLGLSLGDVTGIGPEVAVKALRSRGEDGTAWVLFGDSGYLRKACADIGWDPAWSGWPGREKARPGIWLEPTATPELPQGLRPGAAEAARSAYAALKRAADASQSGELDGVVTGPVNKEAILRAGIPFIGQTEVVTEAAGDPNTAMMLLGTDERGRWLRVLLATVHIPLKDVPAALSPGLLRDRMNLADLACAQLGLARRRIGVCGLNPHAGEGGYLGREEVEWIGATVAQARAQGLDVEGPLAADTLFYRALRGEFDVVVAMYHDQGLAPLKLVAFDTGVNWTVGLPFVRTSPDHGTAYELVGRGVASSRSMEAAMDLAVTLADAARLRS